MIPKKPAPDLIRGGNRFSEKHAPGLTRGIMLNQEAKSVIVIQLKAITL